MEDFLLKLECPFVDLQIFKTRDSLAHYRLRLTVRLFYCPTVSPSNGFSRFLRLSSSAGVFRIDSQVDIHGGRDVVAGA
jgi:hypothetical protein